MEKITPVEKKVRDYYENIWSSPIQIEGRDEDPFLGFHFGFYENGIKNWKEAAINMNDYVGRLLKLDNNKNIEILDVGCGIGSTSIYLAMKYPKIKFTGITLAPSEIEFTKKSQREKQVKNTKFFLENYLNTTFHNDNFDGAFAIESFCYAEKKGDFVKEMKRILKSSARIVVLDSFRTDKKLGSFTQKIYESFLSRRAIPNLISITDFKLCLEKEGFKEINILDLTKNIGIVNYFLQVNFPKFFLNFFLLQFKRIFKSRTYKPKEGTEYIVGALVPEILLGITKKTKYYSITAVKE